MLFSYPIEATQENWLHDCLCEMINSVHTHINEGTSVPAWQDIIPAEHKKSLEKRTSLGDRLKEYEKVVQALTAAERATVICALLNQNNIQELLAKTCNCPAIYDLPLSIQAPIKSLFERSFELLTDLKIRDKQYKTIFSRIRFKVCPFCGCEYFDAPSAKREALDHYLAESKYPFAAANLKNLAPMGAKCNSKYKLAKDILYADDGSRRAAFYPYTAPGLQVSLDLSQPKDGDDGSLTFDWSVEFLEPCEEAETWDQVFEIRDRYKRDILDVCFKDWLEEFKNWCITTNLNFEMDEHVIDAIDRFAWYQHQCFKDMAFLKASVFRMLKKLCIDGNDRILQVMRDLTGMSGVAV